MTLESDLRNETLFFTEDDPINTVAMNYEAKLDFENSMGAQARKLWGQKFREAEPYAQDYKFIFTGIGGAPGSNQNIEVSQFGDGSMVAPFIDLKETFGRIPKILYLLSSPYTADGVLNLSGLADIYKDQGVEQIIAMLTSLGHERQDGYFLGKDGILRKQVPTLRYTIENLARHVDGAFLIQPHSLASIEIGLQYGFPILPMDPLKRMMRQFRQRFYKHGIVLGPDFGRKDDGRMAAASL